jgi:hypothetical protein
MAMTPGLNPFLRQNPAAPEQAPPEGAAGDVMVNLPPELGDVGQSLMIEHDDGSVSVSLDGRPIVGEGEETEAERAKEWFRNLVDEIDSIQLSIIGEELLRGVSDDLTSRNDWIEDRAEGLKLLGLKIELPNIAGASDGAPVEGMSKVRHPLLLEAVLRFQANARSELLPTGGPVKIDDTALTSSLQKDRTAEALERDMNYYLTAIDKNYYPDTDRMLFMLGFGGTSFKKVYFCPLRGRPVSDTVDADDLIVNQSATSLVDAKRITHRVYMRPSTVKRLQILGVYRDIDLNMPGHTNADAVQQGKSDIQGVAVDAANPDDRDREIYEIYCELDIPGFEHKHKGKVTGLEIPYRVTIDVTSREILSIVRNYDEPEETSNGLPEARTHFVKYSFVPGLGFYDIGLLHILGNTTNAVTAAWREMLDAGMYANFPGFLMADTGGRQNTNIFRVPPGGGALVKTNGMPINQAVMPLPYKEPGQALFNLVQNMVETGQRVGGTSELQVGEGRQDAPVGTTIALIDQAVKILNAVHKRMHAAQSEEFQLLVRCFRENPETFWGKNKRPAQQWDEKTFLAALDDYDLVPQADPNTPSHMQRVMKVMALKQLQMSNPGMYNAMAVDTAALQTLGWSNPEQFLIQPNPNAPPPPEVQAKMMELQIRKQDADTKLMKAQADVAKIQSEIQSAGQEGAPQLDPNKLAELELKKMELQERMMDAQARQQQAERDMARAQLDMISRHQQIEADRQASELKYRDDQMEAENRMRDRESSERIAAVKLAQDVMKTPGGKKAMNGIVDTSMLRRLREDEKPIGGL